MNKKQYNNIIKHTLENEIKNSDSDNLENIRKIFKNMGVALPVGNLKEVNEALKSEDFMGWRSCTAEEAKAAANNGTAAIGISDTKISLLAADEENSFLNNETILSVNENFSNYSEENPSYFIYSALATSNYPYVDIPQDGNIGTVISYEGYHCITATDSYQYKLKMNSRATGRYSISQPEYYAKIDGRIVIATKSNIGNILPVSIGDYVTVYFKSSTGSVFYYECIIGDIKGDGASNIWGHYDGKGVVEIIYHDYNPPAGYNSNKNNPWGKGRVIRIEKVGSYGNFY